MYSKTTDCRYSIQTPHHIIKMNKNWPKLGIYSADNRKVARLKLALGRLMSKCLGLTVGWRWRRVGSHWRSEKMEEKKNVVLLKLSQLSSPSFVSLTCREHIYSTHTLCLEPGIQAVVSQCPEELLLILQHPAVPSVRKQPLRSVESAERLRRGRLT